MFRARMTALALSAGLTLVSGCGLMGGGNGGCGGGLGGGGLFGGGLFGGHCCRQTQADCCGSPGGITSFGGGPVIASGNQFPMPQPTPPVPTAPGVGNPPRVVPIPQATPMPYTP